VLVLPLFSINAHFESTLTACVGFATIILTAGFGDRVTDCGYLAEIFFAVAALSLVDS